MTTIKKKRGDDQKLTIYMRKLYQLEISREEISKQQQAKKNKVYVYVCVCLIRWAYEIGEYSGEISNYTIAQNLPLQKNKNDMKQKNKQTNKQKIN